MFKKRFNHSAKFISMVVTASLLFLAVLAFAHHHQHHDQEHGEDSSSHCSICFVAHSLASADQPSPVAIPLQQGLTARPSFCFIASFEIEKSVWLQHPVVHGPPSA